MNTFVELLVVLLILLGSLFALLGSVGLARLPDFFTRLHGPTKATTLGVGAMVLASAVYFTATKPGLSLHELAVMLFLFITAPVSAHLLAKAALHRRTAERARDVDDAAHHVGERRSGSDAGDK